MDVPVRPPAAGDPPAVPGDEQASGGAWRVAFTRGPGCAELADLLALPARPRRVDGDLRNRILRDRVELLVTRRLSSFDLVAVAVPHGVELDRVEAVTAAVAGGPHSRLAVEVAARIAEGLDLHASVITALREGDDPAVAETLIAELLELAPRSSGRVVRAGAASDLVKDLTEQTLLVLGAPGGSWFQRQFFGAGRRLLHAAPVGAVVVRDVPVRCFQRVTEAAAVGPQLLVGDARRVVTHAAVPVAEAGRLVGIVRRSALRDDDGTRTVGEVMEPAVCVAYDEPLSAADELVAFLDGAPVPVVDDDGRLLGWLEGS